MKITKVYTNSVFGIHNYTLTLKQKEIKDTIVTYNTSNQVQILDVQGPNIETIISLVELEQKRKQKTSIYVTIPTKYRKTIRCFYNQGYTLQKIEYNYKTMRLSKELKTNT